MVRFALEFPHSPRSISTPDPRPSSATCRATSRTGISSRVSLDCALHAESLAQAKLVLHLVSRRCRWHCGHSQRSGILGSGMPLTRKPGRSSSRTSLPLAKRVFCFILAKAAQVGPRPSGSRRNLAACPGLSQVLPPRPDNRDQVSRRIQATFPGGAAQGHRSGLRQLVPHRSFWRWWQQSLILVPNQSGIRDAPLSFLPTSTGQLLGIDPAEPAPLAHSILFPAEHFGELLRSVKLSNSVLFQQRGQARFDSGQTFQHGSPNVHGNPQFRGQRHGLPKI